MRFPEAANYTVPDRIIDHFKMNWESVSCFRHAFFDEISLLKTMPKRVDLSYRIFGNLFLDSLSRKFIGEPADLSDREREAYVGKRHCNGKRDRSSDTEGTGC